MARGYTIGEEDDNGYPGDRYPLDNRPGVEDGSNDTVIPDEPGSKIGTGEGGPTGPITPGGNDESPRERQVNQDANDAFTSSPRKPKTPDIRSGGVETTGQGGFTSQPTGVIPFKPLGGGVGSPSGPKSSLFGSLGGLKGGGLGVPSIGSPMGGGGGGGEDGSGLIDSLMSILRQRKGGMF